MYLIDFFPNGSVYFLFCPEGELVDCDGKSESSPEREAVDEETKGTEGADGVKKRKRKPYRPGII